MREGGWGGRWGWGWRTGGLSHAGRRSIGSSRLEGFSGSGFRHQFWRRGSLERSEQRRGWTAREEGRLLRPRPLECAKAAERVGRMVGAVGRDPLSGVGKRAEGRAECGGEGRIGTCFCSSSREKREEGELKVGTWGTSRWCVRRSERD